MSSLARLLGPICCLAFEISPVLGLRRCGLGLTDGIKDYYPGNLVGTGFVAHSHYTQKKLVFATD